MRHVADIMADVVKALRAEDCDLAARWLIEAGQRTKQSSFARAVVAEDGVELAPSELGGHAAQSGKAAELLDEVRDCNDRDGRGFSQRNSALCSTYVFVDRNSSIIDLNSATAASSIPPGLFTSGLSLSQRFR